MLIKTIDGAPDAVKVACPVWSGGKDGDNFKVLPITIGGTNVSGESFPLCMDGMSQGSI